MIPVPMCPHCGQSMPTPAITSSPRLAADETFGGGPLIGFNGPPEREYLTEPIKSKRTLRGSRESRKGWRGGRKGEADR